MSSDEEQALMRELKELRERVKELEQKVIWIETYAEGLR